MPDAARILERYTSWFKSHCTAQSFPENGWIELTVPLLDRHNDCLQVYIRRDGGLDRYRITDDGETFRDLHHRGIDVWADEEYRAAAEAIMRGFGLGAGDGDGEIKATATEEELPGKINMVFLAMLTIGAMRN